MPGQLGIAADACGNSTVSSSSLAIHADSILPVSDSETIVFHIFVKSYGRLQCYRSPELSREHNVLIAQTVLPPTPRAVAERL